MIQISTPITCFKGELVGKEELYQLSNNKLFQFAYQLKHIFVNSW